MFRCILLGLIRFYQTFISPLLPRACRFSPSCSHYTFDAIRIHGIPHGVWLGLRRFLRCHPYNPGGYDPVPEKAKMNRPSVTAPRGAESVMREGLP